MYVLTTSTDWVPNERAIKAAERLVDTGESNTIEDALENIFEQDDADLGATNSDFEKSGEQSVTVVDIP
jgi:hypothetical protein